MHEELAKTLTKLLYKQKAIEARLDALTGLCTGLAMKQGWTFQQVHQSLKQAEDQRLQEKLEQIEQIDPGFAAEIDQRPNLPDD
jgi:hypothetical protein